jgi:hypothetical protein
VKALTGKLCDVGLQPGESDTNFSFFPQGSCLGFIFIVAVWFF